MSELESPEKIAKDIAKLERNLNQVAHIMTEQLITGTIPNIILKRRT